MITSTGIGSGLDIEGLVTQLVAAERAPAETRLNSQQARASTKLSAFGVFSSALASFQDSLAQLSSISSFNQRAATSSDSTVVGITANNSAVAASYDITVSQLAKPHSLASGSFAATTDVVGTGTLTIRFGTTDYTPPVPGPESYNQFTVNPERGAATITIDSSNNTLAGVRDAINSANAGVGAVIVNDGTGFRLLLTSDSTGAQNSLEIAVADTGDGNNTDTAGLSALSFNAGATNLSQTVAAQDALFTINGLPVASAQNTASDAISGVNLTFKGTSTAPVSASISENHDAVKQLITDFVAAYNSFNTTAAQLTSYDPDTRTAGPLQGDFSARSISSQLSRTVVDAVAGFNGPFQSLVGIGITTQADGSLAIDDSALDTALQNNFDKVSGLFAAAGFPSDSNIDYISASSATTVASYDVNISSLASQGQLTGAAITGFPLTIDANNDNLTLLVDGISSGSIALTQGTYATGSDLAAELQTQINGDTALVGAGARVTVSFAGNQLTITSNRYGAASQVNISAVDTNTAASLGLAVANGTDGLDVAGTIGGVAATGAGQTLTGATGSDAEGLQLLISGGPLGARGTVDFSRGVADQLNTLIDSFIQSSGVISSRTGSLQDALDTIAEQRTALDRRMQTVEARFRSRFTALDTLMSQLQNTSNFLTQQLANLPQSGSLN